MDRLVLLESTSLDDVMAARERLAAAGVPCAVEQALRQESLPDPYYESWMQTVVTYRLVVPAADGKLARDVVAGTW